MTTPSAIASPSPKRIETICTTPLSLVTSDDVMFIATGLTSGAYVHHVKVGTDADGRYMTTDTVVLSGSVGNIRRVQTTLHV